MTHDEIREKARYYAKKIHWTPSRFRDTLKNAEERAVFDAALLAHRQAMVEGTAAKYSSSRSLRRYAA